MSKENHWTQNDNMQYMGLIWSLQMEKLIMLVHMWWCKDM
jgi:hypothetical protein